MFTVTSHTLMMQSQAAPKFNSLDTQLAGLYPGAGLKKYTATGLRSLAFSLYLGSIQQIGQSLSFFRVQLLRLHVWLFIT